MKHPEQTGELPAPPTAARRRDGFTLIEFVIASTISALVVTAVISNFIWSGRQITVCGRIGMSQKEALSSSGKLMQYIRNASRVAAFDAQEGAWVELAFLGGGVERLAYERGQTADDAGRLMLVRSNGTQTVVADSVTEIQEAGGFTTPVFTQTGTNTVRVAYRVAVPGAENESIAARGPFGVSVQFAVCLRNAPE